MTDELLIPALKTGNIDLILSSMTATDERRKSIDFPRANPMSPVIASR